MTPAGWIICVVTAAATLAVTVRAWARQTRGYGILLAFLFVSSDALTYLRIPHALTINMWADFYTGLAILWLCTNGVRRHPSLNDFRFQLVICLFSQVAAHTIFEASRSVAGAWWWLQLVLNVTFALMLASVEFRPRVLDGLRAIFGGAPNARRRNRRRGVVARADDAICAAGKWFNDSPVREKSR